MEDILIQKVLKLPICTSKGLSVLNNPVYGELIATINADKNSKVAVLIIDAAGKQLIQNSMLLQSGKNIIKIDLSTKAQGMYYFVLVNSDGTRLAKPFIKK